MRTLNAPRRAVALSSAAFVTVVISGCSGSSTGGATNPATPAPTSSAAAASSPAAASSDTSTTSAATGDASTASASPDAAGAPDKAALKKMLLVSSDLPSGWQSATNTSSDDPASGAAVNKCVGLKDTTADQVATAKSPDFNKDHATVYSDAKSFKSMDSITQHKGAFNDTTKLQTCLEKSMRKQLKSSIPKGGSIDDISVTAAKGPAAGQPDSVEGSIAASIKLTASGQTATLYLQTSYLSRGHVRARVTFENVEAKVPASMQNTLVSAVDKRLPAA